MDEAAGLSPSLLRVRDCLLYCHPANISHGSPPASFSEEGRPGVVVHCPTLDYLNGREEVV